MEKRMKLIPFGLLLIYLIRSLILNSVGLNEVILLAILTGLTVFYEMKLSNKKTLELQTQLNNLVEHNKIQDKNIDDLKNSMVSVKVSSGVRGLSGR